jgi:murein L,D-transpeptidase YcbB/YkuD
MRNRAGKALILALFSVALPSCSKSGNPFVRGDSSGQQADASQLKWTGKAEKQLLQAIANAPANGLKPELFLKAGLPAGDGERAALLTQAALKYAAALASGYADPTKLGLVYTIPRPREDLRHQLADAVQHGNVDQWLASLPPQTDEYKALSQAHLHYLRLAGEHGFQPVPDGAPIKRGARGERVAALAAALSAMGYLSAPAQAKPTRYSSALIGAVKRIQSDFGLKMDGVVGGNTLAAVNLGPGGLARECAIAMERLRWLDRDPPKTRIDVNTAATFLDYWRDGQHLDRRNVVTGEPDKQTPQIQAPMVNLVAYPKWRVPKSIGDKELASKGGGWLAANHFSMENGQYVQASGPKNSLGIVKFDMDDKQSIYLHDTPAKALFALPDRHRSHGCVRVQDAVAFANALATEEVVADQFHKAMAGNEEKFVKLPKPITVRLLYHTAFWDGSRVQFRPDDYGWDDNVAAALGLVRGVRWQPVEQAEDVGP